MNELFVAAKHGKAVTVKRLVIENVYSPEEISQAIEFASSSGHKEIVKHLFEFCPSAICSDTTIINATNVHHHDLDFMKLLIDHGGKVSFSVLLTATIRGHNKLVSLLIKCFKWPVGDLSKAFEYAAWNDSIDLMNDLIKAGAVPCNQALSNAIDAQNYYVVIYLIDLGLRPQLEDFVAVKNEKIEKILHDCIKNETNKFSNFLKS